LQVQISTLTTITCSSSCSRCKWCWAQVAADGSRWLQFATGAGGRSHPTTI
jgi:hypothetical protein